MGYNDIKNYIFLLVASNLSLNVLEITLPSILLPAWLCMKLESASRNASNSRKLSSVAAGTYYADQGKAL